MKGLIKFKNTRKARVIYVDKLNSKKSNALLPFICQLITLVIGLTGLLYSISTSINMNYSIFDIALICAPCLVVASLFTLSKPVFVMFLSVFTASLAGVILFADKLTAFIKEAFSFYYNMVIQIVVDEGYTNYASSMTEDISAKLTDTALLQNYYSCIILVLAIIFSVIFASTLIKRSLIWLCILPCFIILTPSLYFGAVPDGVAFAVFLSGMIGCYAQYISYYIYKNTQKKRDLPENKKKMSRRIGHAYNTAVSALFTTVAVLVLSVSVSDAVYSSEILQIESIREFIDNAANEIMNKLFYKQYETADGAIGGLLDGDILELKTPEFRNLPVMTVTTKTNSSLYLRGWFGTDLQEDGWSVVNDKDDIEYRQYVGSGFDQFTQFYNYTKIVSGDELSAAESIQDTQKLGFVYDTVTVKAKFTKSLLVFLPVMSIDTEITGKYRGVTTLADTVIFFDEKRPKGNTYKMDSAVQSLVSRDFYLAFKDKQEKYLELADLLEAKDYNLNDEEMFIKSERKYAEYVKQKYLTVPEGTKFLDKISEDVTKSYVTDFDKSLAIERYFKTEYNYAKAFTTVAGSAVDKIKYLVNQSKTGYCTYYATAMTVMLRRLGIPARYVVGYHAMVVPEDGSNKYVRELKDDNYHAWVEAYFDGIGWITFDPTPGSGTNELLRDYDYLDDPLPDMPDNNDAPVDNTPPTPVIPPEYEEPVNDEGSEMPTHPPLPTWLVVVIIVVSVIVIFAIIIVFTLLSIVQKFNAYYNSLRRLDSTLLVKTVYPNMLRLYSSLGYRPYEGEMIADFAKRIDSKFKFDIKLVDIIDLLEMAQFSSNSIDKKSAEIVFDYFTKLCNTVFYSLNIFKRYYYMATIRKRKF